MSEEKSWKEESRTGAVCLTFDIEERFHSHLAAPQGAREWRAGKIVERLADWLDEKGLKATFFVVGEFARHYPELIAGLASAGHEIGSHTWSHLRLDRNERARYREEIRRSKEFLEKISGREVVGFRAPSWLARRSDTWLWEALTELGFHYDSSLFPFPTGVYGSWKNPAEPYRLTESLWEIPPAVWRRGILRIPYAGGVYFRILPLRLLRFCLDSDLDSGRVPVLYFHPWEFDSDAPAPERGRVRKFLGSAGIEGAWRKFEEFLKRCHSYSLTLSDLVGGFSHRDTETLRERKKVRRGEGTTEDTE